MERVSNWKEFVNGYSTNYAIQDPDKDILRFMKNAPILAAAAGKLFDDIAKKYTDISLVAYQSGDFVWDSRDIFYYDTYGMPLNKNFVKYVLKH